MAAAVDERNRSLKQALIESLAAILSPDQEVRKQAEEHLKVLEVTEEFGVHLAELAIDTEGALAIRQLASVILKQYVEAHWCCDSEKFHPPETPPAAKTAIRCLLPAGLSESISKVRSSVAYAISAIAHWDWPEAWPELFGLLMEALMSGNPNLVHGAMRVLTEFCREVTDAQMPQVAPVILPEMYKIFVQDQVYSVRIRSRAVDIFNTCAGLICAMSDYQKDAPKLLLFPVLPQFIQAFTQALGVPDSLTSDCGLKMEVLKALATLVKNFSKQMGNHIMEILPHVWSILTHSADRYVKTVVNDTEEADDPVDSDGEVLGFENLVFSVFEFIHGLIETPRFRKTVKKFLNELIYFLLLYMQITEDQIQVWSSNPNQFVEDEDDDTFSYSVRIAAQDVLLAVSAEFKNEGAVTLASAVTRHVDEANNCKRKGDTNWWKLHEACMLAMGCVKSIIIDKISSEDIVAFLNNVVLVDLQESVSPFLVGQALWVGSRFTPMMNPALLNSFLQASVSGLQNNQLPAVRICSVRAVYEFCEHLKKSNNTQQLVPYLRQMMDGLLAMATQSSDDVLALVLETLRIVMSVDKEFTTTYEQKIAPLTIALFIKLAHDAALLPLIEDLFKELAMNSGCNKLLQQRFIPTVISIFQSPPEKTPLGIHAVCIDVLTNIIKFSEPPLSDLLLNNVFPVLIKILLNSDDNAVLQSGGECLRMYLIAGAEQLYNWKDSEGNNGISYVIQGASHLLDPRGPEFTASFAGRLVTTLLHKVGKNLGDQLDLLLRGVLSKLHQAETLSVIQSLILVFVKLMNSQLETTIEFLSGVPDPTGKSALENILKIWCARQPEFYGVYDNKVSTLALCNVLQYFINTGDKRLQVVVKGDRIYPNDEGIRTRSKAAKTPEQWTMIPMPVKIFKLLINELGTLLESAAEETNAESGGESDEGEEGWEDDDEEEMAGHTLSSILGQFAPVSDFAGFHLDEGPEEDDDDPEITSDPIYTMDLQAHLVEFVRRFVQQPCFQAYQQALNPQERHTLSRIGITT
ncbi:importin-9 [Nematostella vectensis]|uniref:importin-9 n=1 Tax=Nematostella vectensis TaxID=45351 RepID=UPI00207722B0|nr:importin-9 [Nematostella vectensis]